MLAILYTVLLGLAIATPVPVCEAKRDVEGYYESHKRDYDAYKGGGGGHKGDGHGHGDKGDCHDYDHGHKPCIGGPCGPGGPERNDLVFIHPNGNKGKCVDIAGGKLEPGTQVRIWDCNATPAQRFRLSRGNGQIMVGDTALCLEAIEEKNGGQVTIGRCNRSLRQEWWYTDDNRIAMTGRGLCLDLPNGQTWNGNPLQVWGCGAGNTNQVWTTSPVGVPF
ncbi:uncharacterized protein CcaverHIS019_0309560 [Cutaneotrichosporon cavernicola]|uniref:Ricin B lectin domain-containing protein n=1 Tax=Cutaneotrichosporon cavernicola TaxID=279322 RepID=A0AA48IFX9_9TREE|nr:uncharacterized protein CcaverHIS019_0309560 [Cutaneotrichosporon cavernicola]BEI90886.1 hypothetical protein CcaverHIS019_0309560 [Cutaneotrichosporon cavernicola]BEI98665.1 hypothetical protein CcaverHIS631_0309640 [Cutaneotrichosporon cavernicola]